MNPNQNRPQQNRAPQAPPPRQQVAGSKGAVFVNPKQPKPNAPRPDPRATFAPDLHPGSVIPGNKKLPIKTGKTPVKINQNSTQNHLQIAEIRDGIVIMNDGSFRSVAMVKSINFDLMSPSERDGVEFSYQSFLNSLYFPVQIYIRSEKIDIRPYIDRLDKIRSEHDNMLLALLMDDYLDFIDNLASQTNIMDKHFYIVIPYFPKEETQHAYTSSKNLLDGILGMFSGGQTHIVINEANLEEAKTELRNRTQTVLGGLEQCGVQGLPLDTQELIELYYNTYNPDTATRQELKNFDDLSVPIITKGQGQAPQPNLDRELKS